MWTARSDEFVHVSSFNRPILVTNQNTGLLKELWLNVTQRGLQVQNYIFTRGGVTLLAGNDSSALSCLRSVVFKGELQTHTHTHTHEVNYICAWALSLIRVSATLTHTHTHTRLTAPFPGLPGWAGTRKVKPIWTLLKQETVSDSGISWAICKSAPRSRQITMPIPHHSVFTGRMPFLPPNQQRQSTEGNSRPYIHCVSKKQDTKFLPITSPNVNRFSKFFHWQTHW